MHVTDRIKHVKRARGCGILRPGKFLISEIVFGVALGLNSRSWTTNCQI